jgi:tRNA-specific adenosine deaminase 1
MAALKSSIGTELPAGALGQFVVRGRNGYENFGAIRTKPGRADSVPSICMSCSDKIANWSILGLQGALLDEVFEPVWVDHLVVGGVEEVAPEGWRVDEGVGWREMIRRQVERALWGRLSSLESTSQIQSGNSS